MEPVNQWQNNRNESAWPDTSPDGVLVSKKATAEMTCWLAELKIAFLFSAAVLHHSLSVICIATPTGEATLGIRILRTWVEPATCKSQVQLLNHHAPKSRHNGSLEIRFQNELHRTNLSSTIASCRENAKKHLGLLFFCTLYMCSSLLPITYNCANAQTSYVTVYHIT